MHENQGWSATVTAHGASVTQAGVEGFDDACEQARKHGVRLRGAPIALAQIDRAGNVPGTWPQYVVSPAGFRGWP